MCGRVEPALPAPGPLSNEELMRHLHELQVRQIELEMQNAGLAEQEPLKNVLKSSRDRYAQLYEQAPVSYFSLTREGLITRVNVAACGWLQRDKDQLLGRRFEQFIALQAQGEFRRFSMRFLAVARGKYWKCGYSKMYWAAAASCASKPMSMWTAPACACW
ncbi:hypothetical protein BA896_016850 [Janthinobacterium lividum]|uniref:PAS domain-containing protein n=1 Tax=Janthinobacterium lividum TaxID=29581 RepID=A0A1E8PMJ0_9BURK|nr:hypothetical protein BA896_016850 [Janthinobacterium lividum]